MTPEVSVAYLKGNERYPKISTNPPLIPRTIRYRTEEGRYYPTVTCFEPSFRVVFSMHGSSPERREPFWIITPYKDILYSYNSKEGFYLVIGVDSSDLLTVSSIREKPGSVRRGFNETSVLGKDGFQRIKDEATLLRTGDKEVLLFPLLSDYQMRGMVVTCPVVFWEKQKELLAFLKRI